LPLLDFSRSCSWPGRSGADLHVYSHVLGGGPMNILGWSFCLFSMFLIGWALGLEVGKRRGRLEIILKESGAGAPERQGGNGG